MPMRSSSLANNPLAITREMDGRYDVVLQVRDNLDLIEQVVGVDFAAILAELESAQDFTGITVVQGETVAWDAVNKILTVPKGDKGDKGNTGLTGPQGLQGIQGPQGIKGDTGLKGDTGSQGPKGFTGATGAQGLKGDTGDDLTITQITYNGNGTFNWLFSDGTSYTTPDLRGPKGDVGSQGVKGDQGISVHHIKGTSTTDSEGDFGSFGEIDTYTVYGDAAETINLGYFRVNNGLAKDGQHTIMYGSTYDTNGNGIVDNSERLEGKTLYEVQDFSSIHGKPNTLAGYSISDAYTKTEGDARYESKNANIQSHIARVDNPHGVTKAQVGLGNVDNTADSNKNVLSATKLTTARNIALTGYVTGNINFDGSANVSIATTIAVNSVALGTDTTGNYVAGATAGTGISISGTAGEGWSPTITNTAPNVTTDISITHGVSSVTVNSSDGLDGTINAASQTLAGIMTAADKTKLDGIATGATANTGTVTSIATTGAITGGTITTTGTISHSTADGFLHVPATGTTNNGKVLTAGATAGSLSWTTIPSAQVTSVAGKTGNVTLVKGDVGLGSVDNTADSAKNVLSATKLTTAITINGVSFDGTANITVSDNTKLTKTNPVITGSITEQVYNLTGTEINPANGTIQYKTVSANTTFTEALTSGQSVLLRLIGASSYTITFPTITWVGAVAPTLTANCAIVLWKEQSTLYGSFVGTLV